VTNSDFQPCLSALQNLDACKATYGLADADSLAIGDIDHNNVINSADLTALEALLTG
jgi:hypothetical protein